MPTGAKSCSGLKVTLLNRRGARVSAVEPSKSVWPSAGAWATRLAAMVPPAPGRFSTTKGRCSRSPSRSAKSRASRSVVVPTLKPQMMWTGFEGQPVADAHDRRLGELLDQELHDALLAGFVERRRRLVHEDPVRLVDQHPGKGHALLLAARQDVVPTLGLVETVAQMIEADIMQHVLQHIVGDALRNLGIKHGIAQRADREIGLLRHEGDGALGQMNGAPAPRPYAGDRPHDRALAAAGLAADQHALGAPDLDFRLSHQHLAVRARETELAHDQRIRYSGLMHRDAFTLAFDH